MLTLELPMLETGEISNAGLQHMKVVHRASKAPEMNVEVNRIQEENDEYQMIHALRNGEETAFRTLIDRHHSNLLRMAQTFVSSRAVAEEVVQDTWLAVIEGISRFEGRSSVKTWLFQILTNKARTKGVRESRYVSFSGAHPHEEKENAMEWERMDTVETVDSRREIWEEHTPERLLLSKEMRTQIDKTIHELPIKQRQVMVLRDVEGLDSDETCGILGITAINQRVLLHRARGKVRTVLNQHFQELGSPV